MSLLLIVFLFAPVSSEPQIDRPYQPEFTDYRNNRYDDVKDELNPPLENRDFREDRANFQVSREDFADRGDPSKGRWQDEVPGTAGEDYPNLREIPETSFTCEDKTPGGYYADVETGCQAFHVCNAGGVKSSFLCPPGSIFNQKYFVCDWWYDVKCENGAKTDAPEVLASRKVIEEVDRSDKERNRYQNVGNSLNEVGDLALAGTGDSRNAEIRENARNDFPGEVGESRRQENSQDNFQTSSFPFGEQRAKPSESRRPENSQDNFQTSSLPFGEQRAKPSESRRQENSQDNFQSGSFPFGEQRAKPSESRRQENSQDNFQISSFPFGEQRAKSSETKRHENSQDSFQISSFPFGEQRAKSSETKRHENSRNNFPSNSFNHNEQQENPLNEFHGSSFNPTVHQATTSQSRQPENVRNDFQRNYFNPDEHRATSLSRDFHVNSEKENSANSYHGSITVNYWPSQDADKQGPKEENNVNRGKFNAQGSERPESRNFVSSISEQTGHDNQPRGFSYDSSESSEHKSNEDSRQNDNNRHSESRNVDSKNFFDPRVNYLTPPKRVNDFLSTATTGEDTDYDNERENLSDKAEDVLKDGNFGQRFFTKPIETDLTPPAERKGQENYNNGGYENPAFNDGYSEGNATGFSAYQDDRSSERNRFERTHLETSVLPRRDTSRHANVYLAPISLETEVLLSKDGVSIRSNESPNLDAIFDDDYRPPGKTFESRNVALPIVQATGSPTNDLAGTISRKGSRRPTGGLRDGLGNGLPGASRNLPGSDAIAGTGTPKPLELTTRGFVADGGQDSTSKGTVSTTLESQEDFYVTKEGHLVTTPRVDQDGYPSNEGPVLTTPKVYQDGYPSNEGPVLTTPKAYQDGYPSNQGPVLTTPKVDQDEYLTNQGATLTTPKNDQDEYLSNQGPTLTTPKNDQDEYSSNQGHFLTTPKVDQDGYPASQGIPVLPTSQDSRGSGRSSTETQRQPSSTYEGPEGVATIHGEANRSDVNERFPGSETGSARHRPTDNDRGIVRGEENLFDRTAAASNAGTVDFLPVDSTNATIQERYLPAL